MLGLLRRVSGVSKRSADATRTYTQVFGAFTVFDRTGKGAVQLDFGLPEFSRNGDVLYLKKPGVLHVNLVPKDEGGSRFDWERKIPFALDTADVGRLIYALPDRIGSQPIMFHRRDSSQSIPYKDRKIIKTLAFERKQGENHSEEGSLCAAYRVAAKNASREEDESGGRVEVELDVGQIVSMREAMRYALPRLIGFEHKMDAFRSNPIPHYAGSGDDWGSERPTSPSGGGGGGGVSGGASTSSGWKF